MCSRIQSSFNGIISEIPGISVDNFEKHTLKSQAFFLSHCHTDHTKGLFSQELVETLKYNQVFIYTSELSKALIEDDCDNDKLLMDHVVPLGSGTTHITLPDIFGHDEAYIRVTLIPAGHCLGSVMFLFETTNKTILYTGDFNISSNDLTHMKPFHDKNKDPINIDVMYIDTTFINKQYEYFPKRSAVIKEMIAYIDDWLKADQNNRVALNTSAKYGYEYVYKQIFEKLNLKVFVSEERWRFYCKHPSLFGGVTNKEVNTKIHICRDSRHNDCSITNKEHFKFLFIRLSAMKWRGYSLEESAIHRDNNDYLSVCFPTHCSSTEIKNFVNYFSPNKVIGFPNKYESNEKRHQSSPSINEVTPKKKKIFFEKNNKVDKKVSKDLLKKIFD